MGICNILFIVQKRLKHLDGRHISIYYKKSLFFFPEQTPPNIPITNQHISHLLRLWETRGREQTEKFRTELSRKGTFQEEATGGLTESHCQQLSAEWYKGG